MWEIYLAIGIIVAIAFFGASAAVVDEPEAGIGGIYIVTFEIVVILIISLNISILKTDIFGLTYGELLSGFLGSILGSFFGKKAISDDQRFSWLWKMYLDVAIIGGTNFSNADLTDADFSSATLHSTDLRAKSLTRTCFKDTKKLIQARAGKTILADSNVRELLVTGYGYKKSYINANLRGAYLAAANLSYANLTQADLAEANLQQANLEKANLTQINAIGTDFTEASMTGACLEAWNIESSTKLDEVDCRFVYLLEHPKPGTDDRELRPSSGDFQPGEFTKLFEEVIDTVDLIFRNGIDWKAFVSAFKQVQVENEDTPLIIQSIENKGDGVVVVKVSVPPNTDKEKIHQEFNQNYDLALKAIEEKYKAQLEAKDHEIANHHKYYASLEKITETLANKPIYIENKAMSNSNDQSRTFQVGDVGGDFKPVGAPILSDNVEISGTVAETINQLPSSSETDKPGIKELLNQLKEAIEDPNLPEDDKNGAVEQLQVLAEAGKNPEDETMQKKAKKAIGFLQVIAGGLEPATKLVGACQSVIPAIAAWFGF